MNGLGIQTYNSVDLNDTNYVFDTFNENEVFTDVYSTEDDAYGTDERFYYSGDLNRLRKPWLTEAEFIPTVIIYGLAFLVGIVGNSLVIVAIVEDNKQRTNTIVFLLNLATSDIIFLLFCVPYEISRHFIGHWQIGAFLCKLSGFVEMTTAVLSVLNLTIVSIERYVVIVHPMRSRSLCTLGNMRKVIPVVWIIAVILSLPTLFIMSTEISVFYNNHTSVNIVFCSDNGVKNVYRTGFAGYQLIIMFLIPTIVMIVCYAKVVHVLWISTKQLSLLTPSERVYDALFPEKIETRSLRLNTSVKPRLLNRAIISHKYKVLASRKQVIKLLLMIIIAFLLSWCPKLTMRILQKLQLPFLFSESAYIVKVFVDWLPFIHSSINPLFYCLMSRKFRRSIRMLFSWKSHKSILGSAELVTMTCTSEERPTKVFLEVQNL